MNPLDKLFTGAVPLKQKSALKQSEEIYEEKTTSGWLEDLVPAVRNPFEIEQLEGHITPARAAGGHQSPTAPHRE